MDIKINSINRKTFLSINSHSQFQLVRQHEFVIFVSIFILFYLIFTAHTHTHTHHERKSELGNGGNFNEFL